MPEKVVRGGNIEEDVKLIVGAISRFLENYKISIEKGKEGYELYLKDHDKEYLLGAIFKRGTTDHYTMLLFFDVFLPAYIIKGRSLSIQEFNNIEQEMLPKDEKRSIVEEIVEFLKNLNLEITVLDFGRVSVILDVRKKPPPKEKTTSLN